MEPFEFDIQRLLNDMEDRIREDIRNVGTLARSDAAEARRVADAATLSTTELDGRVTSLEEKAGWGIMGFGMTFVALGGFVWHLITGKG